MMEDQKRRSILCPNCGKLISNYEASCPHCGLRNPGSRLKNIVSVSGILKEEQIIRNIIYLNAGMYILSILINPRSIGLSMNPLGFLSPGGWSLFVLGASGTDPIDQLGRWWTLLSANYLHGSILHILFNMMALRQIGPLILHEYGGYRMFSIYTLSGVGGLLVSYLAGVPLTVGASAALCGLIGAALYYGKSRGGQFGQMVYQQVGGWAISIFVFGFLFPGIDNWAHGGGMLCGVLAGFFLGYNERKPQNFLHKAMAGVCVFATLAALAWGVGSTFALMTGILRM